MRRADVCKTAQLRCESGRQSGGDGGHGTTFNTRYRGTEIYVITFKNFRVPVTPC